MIDLQKCTTDELINLICEKGLSLMCEEASLLFRYRMMELLVDNDKKHGVVGLPPHCIDGHLSSGNRSVDKNGRFTNERV